MLELINLREQLSHQLFDWLLSRRHRREGVRVGMTIHEESGMVVPTKQSSPKPSGGMVVGEFINAPSPHSDSGGEKTSDIDARIMSAHDIATRSSPPVQQSVRRSYQLVGIQKQTKGEEKNDVALHIQKCKSNMLSQQHVNITADTGYLRLTPMETDGSIVLSSNATISLSNAALLPQQDSQESRIFEDQLQILQYDGSKESIEAIIRGMVSASFLILNIQ